ncbi:MAG: Glycosyltransferase [Ignavibacteria bacterium]|nr:MAG: Glycosyltransferase [Ignavibacteria bacterium]KAF0157605.1 MAG: Glycosyltransferase [Ignavibacteria bacterium]
MRVLFTCLSQSWGGMEMYALTTVKQLLKQNIKTELVCFPGSRLYEEAFKENVSTHTFGFKSYFNLKTIRNFSSLIKQNKYDVIECGGSKDLWLVVPALKLAGSNVPVFLSKQMASFIFKKDFLHRWIYSRVTKAFAISSMIAKNLEETTPLTKDKIVLLHNAIDTTKFDPSIIDRNKVRSEFSLVENEILIGMIARISPGKGHEEFLEAAEILSTKFFNIKFMIVGEASRGEEAYAQKIKTQAAQINLGSKLIFAGFRKDTPEILAALDIFIFPSHDEAFGIALAEALSMGKPSVCSNFAGVLDIAVDNLTSFLFEKGNGKDLALKTEQLIVSKETRERFAIEARKRAVEMFDMEIFTNKLINHFKQSR